MKEKAQDFLKLLTERAVKYSINGNSIKIEDDFLNAVMIAENLESEILALLKPKEPEFTLEITNAELLEPPEPTEPTKQTTPAKEPEPKTKTHSHSQPNPEQSPKPEPKRETRNPEKNNLANDSEGLIRDDNDYISLSPLSPVAFEVYHIILDWADECAGAYDGWISQAHISEHLKNECLLITDYDLRIAIRELVAAKCLVREWREIFYAGTNKDYMYSLTGDLNNESYEALRKAYNAGCSYRDMFFYKRCVANGEPIKKYNPEVVKTLREAAHNPELLERIQERACIRWADGLSDSLYNAVLCGIEPLNEVPERDTNGEIILQPCTDWRGELKKFL